MGSAFHQLCPRYSGTLTPTAPTANRLWETSTFTYFQMTNSVLNDPKGPENIVCTIMMYGGDALRPPHGTSPAAVKINKF